MRTCPHVNGGTSAPLTVTVYEGALRGLKPVTGVSRALGEESAQRAS